jgi:uncharacterized protein YndB with AHSA1/START domain
VKGDQPSGPIRWRLFIPAPPEKVFAALDSDDGRAAFWAESAIRSGDCIEFRFINGVTYRSRILERDPPYLLRLDYFGGIATFRLQVAAGGTDLLLTHEGVPAEEWLETHAGWLNVLLLLKARVAFGVDLRNHDAKRTWDDGYVDQ